LELVLRIADGIGADLPALIKKAENKVVEETSKSRPPRKAAL
jgi:hypothetical protein